MSSGSDAGVSAGELSAALIILVYGSNHRHGPLVEAALADGFRTDQLIVVHNPAPGDGGPPEAPGDARLLAMPRNLGYAGAMNAGLAAARHAEIVLFCTDDTRPEPGVLVALANHALADPGVYGPALVRSDGSPFSLGGDLNPRGEMPRHRSSTQASGLVDAGWLDGAILACHRSVIDELGGFDERYFLYAEDLDWSERARRAGFRVAVDTSLRAFTEPGAETRKAAFEYYSTRNGLLRARQTGGTAAVLGRLARETRRTAARLVKRMDGADGAAIARARALGLWHGLRGRGGPAPARLRT